MSRWMWENCQECPECTDPCPYEHPETETLENEFMVWSWWLETVEKLKQCRADEEQAILTWSRGSTDTWTLEVLI